jgi:hypothetical protein
MNELTWYIKGRSPNVCWIIVKQPREGYGLEISDVFLSYGSAMRQFRWQAEKYFSAEFVSENQEELAAGELQSEDWSWRIIQKSISDD